MTHLTLDLSPTSLLQAYAHGIFPMARSRTGRVEWFTADPRAILPLDAFHVPHGLRRALKKNRFTIRIDTAFREVMHGCAQPRKTSAGADTWISPAIIEAYCNLHDLGHAHSVEAWGEEWPSEDCGSPIGKPREGEAQSAIGNPQSPILLGGLYGVALGGAFFGESMFSRATDASKICLVHLVEHLRARGFTLLDVQFRNPHLDQFGIIEIPAAAYLARLREAIALDVTWS